MKTCEKCGAMFKTVYASTIEAFESNECGTCMYPHTRKKKFLEAFDKLIARKFGERSA